MLVLEGRRRVQMTADELAERVGRARRVVIDVGAGDGRTAYRLARAHPDWLVVGLDPAWPRMVDTSVRSGRKPARGGAANLVLVHAAVESAPAELRGVADEVLVLMPWGKLLRGVVAPEPDVLDGLRAMAKPGAVLQITVGTSIWRPPVPREIEGVPALSAAHVASVLAERALASGWRITEAGEVAGGDLDRIDSSWARRLGAAAPEPVFHIAAEAVGRPPAPPPGGEGG